jgi:Spy/CpxP family protein refolding chaperone
MLKFRSIFELRTLALVATAACVLCAPMAARATSTTAKKSHGKAAASEERAELNEHLQQMTDRLSLTDDQVTKVREILKSRATQMNEVRAKYKGQMDTPENKSTLAKARQDVHADTQAKLARVLSASQMAEYKKMNVEHRKRAGESDAKGASASATQR